MPRFSVIIPTCNRPHFVADAVDSVLAQKSGQLEVLVVNDGVQPTPQWRDGRVRQLENARRGAIAARNLGIAAARGEIIAWLDDDDLWKDPLHLARADELLQQGADFTYADGEMQFADGRSPTRFAQDADAASLARDNTILISGICYRRRLHESLGGFDPALPYYADWDWYIRVARAGFALARVRHPTVAIRIHGENTSGDATQRARASNLARLAAKHGLGELTLKTHVDFV